MNDLKFMMNVDEGKKRMKEKESTDDTAVIMREGPAYIRLELRRIHDALGFASRRVEEPSTSAAWTPAPWGSPVEETLRKWPGMMVCQIERQ